MSPTTAGPQSRRTVTVWVSPDAPKPQFEMFSTFLNLSFSYWLIKSLYIKNLIMLFAIFSQIYLPSILKRCFKLSQQSIFSLCFSPTVFVFSHLFIYLERQTWFSLHGIYSIYIYFFIVLLKFFCIFLVFS